MAKKMTNAEFLQRVYNITFDIDEGEKWLYAKEKGVTVFAIYSKHDPDDPTVLYATKGKNAEKKHTQLVKFMEDEKNADSQSGSNQDGASVAQWAALVPPEGKPAITNLPDDGHRGANAEDVPVYVQESNSNSGRADVTGNQDHGRFEVTEHPIRASEKSGAFSMSEQGAEPKTYGKYNVYGKDIALSNVFMLLDFLGFR